MIEKILSRFREVGNIQFSSFSKPLIAVEDAIKIVQEVAKEYGKDTNVRSNADRIRSMSDEELAEFIDKVSRTCLVDALGGKSECNTECRVCKIKFGSILEWLKSEVKE